MSVCQNNNKNTESITREIEDVPNNDKGDKSPTKFELVMITFGLCLCSLVISLDITILATATPNIVASFHALDDVGWYGSAYLLMQTTMQPTFGRVYALFSTKWTFLGSLMVFELGSVLCAVATSSAVFIAGRAVAGVGAAAIFSGGLNIISIIVPLRKHAPYLAILSVMLGIASIAGPPLGGSLTDRLGWRWCFWINLPCGAVAFAVIFLFFKQNAQHGNSDMTFRQRVAEIDFLGSFFLLCGITAFLLGIQWGGSKYPWSNSKVWGSLFASGLCIAAFSAIQWKLGDKANIPARILYKRTILSSALFSCFLSMASYIHMFYLPIYYQAVKGATAQSSGLYIIPYQISNTTASLIAGFGVAIVGWYVPFIWAGSIAFVIGSGLLYTITATSNKWTLVLYQIVAGAGFGASVQLPYLAAQVVSRPEDISSANAIMIFFHSLGGTISLGIAQTLFLSNLARGLSTYAPSINPAIIMAAGPTDLIRIVPEAQLSNVFHAYSAAITKTFIFSIATGGIAFLLSLRLEWKNIRGINMLTGSSAV